MFRLASFILLIILAPENQGRKQENVLFEESFDDAELGQRGWYDGTACRIVENSWQGNGCIEYEWILNDQHVQGSSPYRHLFEPVAGKLRLAATDIQNQDMPHGLTQGPLRGGYNGIFYDSEEVLFDDDKWHCIEAYFRLNTLDTVNDQPNSDGIVRGWFDGKKVIDHKDVILRSTDFPDMMFNQFLMAPYFGPGLLNNDQQLWIDELVVGTERINIEL